jgi:hypothetical protein
VSDSRGFSHQGNKSAPTSVPILDSISVLLQFGTQNAVIAVQVDIAQVKAVASSRFNGEWRACFWRIRISGRHWQLK